MKRSLNIILIIVVITGISCYKKVPFKYDSEIIKEYEVGIVDYPENNRFQPSLIDDLDTELGFEIRIIDTKVNKYLSRESKAELLSCGDQTNIIKLKSNEKWGLVDKFGVELLPFQFDTISNHGSLTEFPSLLIASKNDKYGILSCSFNYYISHKYDWAYKSLSHDLIFVKTDGKFGGIDFKDNILIPMKYDSISSPDGSNIHVHLNNKQGLSTIDHNLKSEIKYDEIDFLTKYSSINSKRWNTLFSYRVGMKYGLLSDATGEITGPISDSPILTLFGYKGRVKKVRNFNKYSQDKFFRFKKNEKFGMIDVLGEVILKPIYERIDYIRNQDLLIIQHRNVVDTMKVEYNDTNIRISGLLNSN